MKKTVKFNSIEELVDWLINEKPEIYFKDVIVNNHLRMISISKDIFTLRTMLLDIELFPSNWKTINGAMVKKDNLGYAIVFDNYYYFMD